MTSRYFSLAIFLLIAVGGGLLIGANNVPGAWYEGLQKPWFNPPNWIFAPVWTVLYVLIGIAGWLVWRRRDRPALTLWFLQMGLNFIWTPVFFGANLLGPALGIALGMLAAAVAFTVRVWTVERRAAWCFVPYVAWVAFASLLNGALWQLNA
ncbi:TspO and MBR related proteins [Aureimonas altamirensis DSM 21988]|uniref:Tryptophan-rich sensory protein n=2 Tax=Aureimonas altamirensis TaxID=370622 RepID=A0A0P0YXM8_9HYPH|nr:TspO/MBR family protein [Aureimonas altamirensis]BAT26223.1 tryptophan-rich sensory protein [Aureimonas altamirensis]SHJ41318.1 TspO and MBR related proteins [Aureimonas altamirensis DSM 21988]